MKIHFSLLIVVLSFLFFGCGKNPVVNSENGTFKDSRDQYVYRFIKIGTQTWMAENLAWLPAVNRPSDGSDTEPRYYVLGYDFEVGSTDLAKTKPNYSAYGVLYNWAAAKTACPSGWHLPTDAEWKILETSLGMSQSDAENIKLRGSGSVGKALKALYGWNNNGNGDNSSGFSALPGGYRDSSGGFNDLGDGTGFWSSSEVVSSGAWDRYLLYSDNGVGRDDFGRSNGFSIRCLKD